MRVLSSTKKFSGSQMRVQRTSVVLEASIMMIIYIYGARVSPVKEEWHTGQLRFMKVLNAFLVLGALALDEYSWLNDKTRWHHVSSNTQIQSRLLNGLSI